MAELYIGLMSGTSLDGVDGVLADFSGTRAQVLFHCSLPFPSALKAELLALNTAGENELHHAWLAGNALARMYAEVVHDLLAQTNTPAAAVRAAGAHGQTVRHRPQEFDGTGYTIQLNQPALLAELTGIDVIADFRSRDVSAGGQGAPLVPPFHQAFFGGSGQAVGVLNIGGISNITLIGAEKDAPVTGFDCGPGNALMDGWCQQHTGATYDDQGAWAAGGAVNTELLAKMLATPYFSQQPPKSTGRDLFNASWLGAQLQSFEPMRAQDVQATLTQLTAKACAQSVRDSEIGIHSLVVCGGGALNLHLMQCLQNELMFCKVVTSDAFGIPPIQVEATAFAWLARQFVKGQSSNLPTVTGAQGRRILGGLYPA